MIAQLRGRISLLDVERCVLDVNGVGYLVYMPGSDLSRLPGVGKEAHVHTSMQVREDSITLYGFLTPEGLKLFERLLTVTGVGPKMALAALGTMNPGQFHRAVLTEDVAGLSRVPGIGKKTAQRLVLELKEKLGDFGVPLAEVSDPSMATALPPTRSVEAEALEALVTLGFGRPDAVLALEKVRASKEPASAQGATAEDLVRLALKQLYRG